ncbi:hypothetical protein [Burkholderia glumae]|uniref:hypothetical protein n=1 Tax=Burkholderia glumae TaxID=337 RepID=UPI001463AB5E|nr:hypothetical protein [Burkholderia glumae]QJP74271.1 hypothetical protein HJC54_29350 [Burkholderia glumae]
MILVAYSALTVLPIGLFHHAGASTVLNAGSRPGLPSGELRDQVLLVILSAALMFKGASIRFSGLATMKLRNAHGLA